MYTRKNAIPQAHQEQIATIAKKIKELRLIKNLSIERFCSKYDIPRITYGNLESGKCSFQITTLLSVLDAHGIGIKSFFQDL